MLTYSLLHPLLLAALASSGHGGQILRADGNYPYTTVKYPDAKVIYLNLRPGMVGINDVLEPMLEATPVEAATVMRFPDGSPVPAHDDYRALLGASVEVREVERVAFYSEAQEATATVAATGDQRICANLLLTLGVGALGVAADTARA